VSRYARYPACAVLILALVLGLSGPEPSGVRDYPEPVPLQVAGLITIVILAGGLLLTVGDHLDVDALDVDRVAIDLPEVSMPEPGELAAWRIRDGEIEPEGLET
jgi:hypothetical protein